MVNEAEAKAKVLRALGISEIRISELLGATTEDVSPPPSFREENIAGEAKARHADAPSPKPSEGYRLRYPTEAMASDQELKEIEAEVEHKGYVLLWSTVLEDLVAFYRDEEAYKDRVVTCREEPPQLIFCVVGCAVRHHPRGNALDVIVVLEICFPGRLLLLTPECFEV